MKDNAGVIAKPPFIYLGGTLIGALIQHFHPIAITSFIHITWVGILVIVSGFLIIFVGVRELRRCGTSESTSEPTTKIVSTGLYRYSRNPLYISLSLLMIGIGLSFNNLWILIMLIPVLIIMHIGVIFREEAYLECKFGQEYLDYKASVRRWF